MYLPSYFNCDKLSIIDSLILENPLATLISVRNNGEPFVSHVPLVMEKTDDKIFLYGHLSRANPHRSLLSQNVYAIFHGPNSYITPTWYEKNNVPTWNYAVVHVKGPCELIEDESDIIDVLKKLTSQMEENTNPSWEFWIPEDLSEKGILEKSIVGFRIVVESLSCKLKMSQNKSETDRQRVVAGLTKRAAKHDEETAALVEAL